MGETVAYIQRNGSKRSLTALVDRDQYQVVDPSGNMLTLRATFEVLTNPDDETYSGIEPSEVDLGGDAFELDLLRNGKTSRLNITHRLPDSDVGLLKLGCN